MIVIRNFVRSLAAVTLTMSLAFTQYLPSAFAKSMPQEKVLIVGGSTADGGGDDPNEHGYISRAFEELNSISDIFQVDNEAVTGADTQKITSVLDTYLKQDHPNIVIISDGFFNDIYNNVPPAEVIAGLKEQVGLAAKSGAEVFVVSSPVTVASLTYYKSQFNQYMHQEFYFASQAKPNVHVLDVFDQMEGYIHDHHIDCQTELSWDGWHTNGAGHKIAADILFKDLKPYLMSKPRPEATSFNKKPS